MGNGQPLRIVMQPIDDQQLSSDGSQYGLVRIFTDHPTIYYWLEWRSLFNGGGLMISWAPIYHKNGMGGERASEQAIGHIHC